MRRNVAFSLYSRAQTQEPLHRGYEIYNFGGPFLWPHYYILLGLSEPCARVQKKIFYEIHQFYPLYTPKLPPLRMVGHEIYNFWSPYHTDDIYQIWFRLAQ